MKAALAFVNGNVLTMDDSFPAAQAVAVRDGRITAVGDTATVKEWIGPDTTVIDLHGRTLLPGFHDSHMHLLSYAASLQNAHLNNLTSIARVIEVMQDQAARTPPGQWILGRGWDQNFYVEGRYPTAADLDQASSVQPISIQHVSGHALAVNTAALRLAGITRDTPDPAGGHIDRGPEGEPTGVLRETAAALVSRFYFPFPAERARAALPAAMQSAHAAGITSITDDSARSLVGGYRAYLPLMRELWASGIPMVRTCQLIYFTELETMLAEGLHTGDGDEQVRVGAVKLFADGSFMAQTAALREPFSDLPGSRGLYYIEPSSLAALVLKANRAGLQTGIHAIGDAGIDSALDAIAAALADSPREDHRHRIIHFEVLTEDILDRAKELEVGADIQPKFVATQGGWVVSRVGEARARLTFPWKMVLERGIPCAGSSDCPVEPFTPLLGIHAAVNRQVDSIPGMTFNPEERLTPEAALRLWTMGSAYSTFEENIKGSITPGKLADLVVLSGDPLTVPPASIRELQVEMTIVGGRIVYPA